MEKVNYRIQRQNQLNDVYVKDEVGAGNGRHEYRITPSGKDVEMVWIGELNFQNGPRNEETSTQGVLDQDLLEIVRHRLQCFQKGEYATRENACALTHIEEALMWMSKRADDRAERGVLGTMNK